MSYAHWACFDCRKSFAKDASATPRKCPECAELMIDMGAFFEPQPEGGWTITCPILRGLITETDTIDEIVPNVTDALNPLIEAYTDLKQPLPTILREKVEFEIYENV